MKPNNYKLNRLAPEHQHIKTYHHTHSLNRLSTSTFFIISTLFSTSLSILIFSFCLGDICNKSDMYLPHLSQHNWTLRPTPDCIRPKNTLWHTTEFIKILLEINIFNEVRLQMKWKIGMLKSVQRVDTAKRITKTSILNFWVNAMSDFCQ